MEKEMLKLTGFCLEGIPLSSELACSPHRQSLTLFMEFQFFKCYLQQACLWERRCVIAQPEPDRVSCSHTWEGLRGR